MKALATELELLRNLVGTLPKRRVLATNQLRPTRRVADQVLAQWDEVTKVSEERLATARRAILAAQRVGDDLWSLPVSILRDAVWLLWPEAKDGIDRIRLRRAIMDHAGTTTSILRRLIDAWLLHFSDDDSFIEVGRRIERHLATPQVGLLDFWKETQRAYDLFNATQGPAQLASRLLKEPEPRTLTACRLDTPVRAVSGYLREVHHALCDKLPEFIAGESGSDMLGRATRFYSPDGELRFDEPRANGAMADGLVGAWHQKSRQPSERLKLEVLTYLRRHLGDPRVDHRGRWAQASSRTRQTVRGWLSKLSLDAFFDVVGRFAGSAGMGHQWKARKAFWGACLQKGHISDSWLVLGDNVARAIADKPELRDCYGRLIDGDPNHSVLLMQIGGLVFSEWTYNGKLRAWPNDWKNAPRLFELRYRGSEVKADCLQFPAPAGRPDLATTRSDGVSHTAVWQGRVAALLRRKEGIVLEPDDWRVR